MFGIAYPLVLVLLPLALLPWWLHGRTRLAYSNVSLLPSDRVSDVVAVALRLFAIGSVIATTLGIAGLFRAEEAVERIGQGAQMVILLDSSGSMDRPFVSGNDHSSRVGKWGTYTSKGQIARGLLAQYAAQRSQDMFALFVFSGNPIAVLPFTEKAAVIQAVINAGSIERGLASTNLGAGLIRSLEFFDGRPFTGSRIIMLVSDGAARLSIPIQDQIKVLLEKYRVTLYWVYLRDRHSPGLYSEVATDTAAAIAPEQLVHKFFSELELPYRAFSAENPDALRQAIAEVNKLQNLPIRYTDIVPKRDLSHWCYAVALLLTILLAAAKVCEISAWR